MFGLSWKSSSYRCLPEQWAFVRVAMDNHLPISGRSAVAAGIKEDNLPAALSTPLHRSDSDCIAGADSLTPTNRHRSLAGGSGLRRVGARWQTSSSSLSLSSGEDDVTQASMRGGSRQIRAGSRAVLMLSGSMRGQQPSGSATGLEAISDALPDCVNVSPVKEVAQWK